MEGAVMSDLAPRTTLSTADYRRAMDLIAEHGVDAVETALRRRRASSPEPVAFRSAGEVIEAYHHKIITRAEARKVLGLRTSTRRRAPSPAPAGRRPQ
jgi:hypothetical protein